jgi:hypothetical protein
MTTFTEQADALLAIAGEMTDNTELIAATRKLRDVAAEHDDVDARFHQAADEVKRLLLAARA